ncbi:S-adenosylmethionine-dependent methyltransferase [Pseudohyphozyma bogoriensis]|nr:S-adenosylmethionine-dependent methyltransferase [Pseudohyphozyma bogoriensis]
MLSLVLLPTQLLPPLPRSLSLSSLDSHSLLDLLDTLESIYSPPSPPDKRENRETGHVDSGYSSSAEDDDSEGVVVSADTTTTAAGVGTTGADDVFELNYAKDWLVRLVRRMDEWVAEVDEREHEGEGNATVTNVGGWDVLLDKAAKLLTRLSETSESGALTRLVNLPTASDELSIKLHDALPPAEDPTSVGLQSWGASIILARLMASDPSSFGIGCGGGGVGGRRRRVLELGAGTGLLSIAWGKLGEREHAEGDEIVATDFHADVLDNLRKNVAANFPSPSPVSVAKLDWSALHSSLLFANSTHTTTSTPSGTLSTPTRRTSLSVSIPPPFNVRFDTIIAADVVYTVDHAVWLKSCVSQLLSRPSPSLPSSSPHPRFHLLLPLREHHAPARAMLPAAFPSRDDVVKTLGTLEERGGRWELAVLEERALERVPGVGRVDEVGYVQYAIGWC